MTISKPMVGLLATITLTTPAVTLLAQTALADTVDTTATVTAPSTTSTLPTDVRTLLDTSTLTINGRHVDLSSMVRVSNGPYRLDGYQQTRYDLEWTGPAIDTDARLETSGRLQYAQDDWTILTLENDTTSLDLRLACERDGNLDRSFSTKGLEASKTLSFQNASTGRTLIPGGTITKGDVYVMYGTFDGKATDKSSFVNISKYDGLIVNYHHSDDGSVASYDVTDPHSGMRATILFVSATKDTVTSEGRSLIDDRVASHTRDFSGVDVHELTMPSDTPSTPSTPSANTPTPATPSNTGQSTTSPDTGGTPSTPRDDSTIVESTQSGILAKTGSDVESLLACMTAATIAGLAMARVRRVDD